jgi:hypothetical protein
LVTYAQIAQQLQVDADILKTFCLRRSLRPRGLFLKQLANNIPRIEPLVLQHKEISLELKRLVLDLAGIEHNRSWYDGFYDFFQVRGQDLAAQGAALVGQYAFYRNFGNNLAVLKSKLEIFPFDQMSNVQRFEVRRKVFGQGERISRGFVFPLYERSIMIAKIGAGEGIITIYAEKPRIDENITGVMLNSKEGDPAFATRVVMMKLTQKNKTLDTGYGLIDASKLNYEIGDYSATISNALEQWATMQIVKL